jgi:hypothetical protein
MSQFLSKTLWEPYSKARNIKLDGVQKRNDEESRPKCGDVGKADHSGRAVKGTNCLRPLQH